MAITTDPTVQAVSAQLPDIDDETVTAVINAWNLVRDGDAPGTIVMSDEGHVAVRISDQGVHLWKVTAANGSTWVETQPTLPGWTVIKEGVASE